MRGVDCRALRMGSVENVDGLIAVGACSGGSTAVRPCHGIGRAAACLLPLRWTLDSASLPQ